MKSVALLIASLIVAGSLQGQSFESLEYPFEHRVATVEGTSIAYHDSGGDGDAMLLVHGLASNMKFWAQTIPALSDYRVVAVDLPGFGKSGKVDVDVSLPAQADLLAGLLSQLGIDRAAVVGHSMGGQVAVHLALAHPDRVDRLVLLAPAGFESFTEAESAVLKAYFTPELTCLASEAAVRLSIGMNVHAWSDQYAWLVADRLAIREEPDFPLYCQAVTDAVASMLDHPVSTRLHEIAVRTLVIAGTEDGLIPNRLMHPGSPEEVFRGGTQAMPDAELVMVPDAGHLVMLERPEEVNAALLRFLRR